MTKTINAEIRPANLMYSMALNSLGLASSANEAWEKNHHLVAGVVFAAFSFEAMINHFARITMPEWSKIENGATKLCRKDFYREFFKTVNLNTYLGTKTFQTMDSCLKLRDRFAHGKTTDETFTTEIPPELSRKEDCHQVLNAITPLEQDCNERSLQLFIDTIQQVETDIESNGKYPTDHPYRPGEQLLECPLSITGVRTW